MDLRYKADGATAFGLFVDRRTERCPSDHVHGYLTSLRGVMDLYHVTEDYFNELTGDNCMLEVTQQSSSTAKQPVRPFAVPIAAKTFRYAPAEFPDQTATVRLRAITQSNLG